MKHFLYPAYVGLIAWAVLFNLAARKRQLGGRFVAAVNLAWGLATAAFMVLASEPQHWFWDLRVGYFHAGCKAFTDPVAMYGVNELTFVNLPIVAVLCVPLAWLGEWGACGAEALASVAVTAAAWAMLARQAALTGWRRWALAGLFLVNGPLFYSLRHGNATHFVLPLLAAALGCMVSGREFRSGLLLGTAALLKPPLLLLPAYFGLRRRWGVAAGCAALLGAAGGASWLLFGVEVHRAWYERCIRPFAGAPITAYNAQSASSFLARLLTDGDVGLGWSPLAVDGRFRALQAAAAVALGMGVYLVCRRRRGADRATATRLEFCLLLCLSLVISPVSWTHYYLLLLLPVALALGGRLGVPLRPTWLASLALAVLAMSPPVRAWVSGPWWMNLMVSHCFAGGVLLLAMLAVARWQLAQQASLLFSPAAAIPRECR